MASYFGEVLETSSRAYGEDYDDDTELRDSFKSEYEISWNSTNPPDGIDLFFITIGKSCLAFSALLRQKSSPELVANITQVQTRDNGEYPNLRERRKIPTCIYQLKSGVYLCEVSEDVQVIHANSFTDKLHEFLVSSKEVIVLTSSTSNRYSSWKSNVTPFLKGLANSNYTASGKEVLAPQLEAPNIITGVAASVLIFCEIKKISGCIYICYAPKEEIDSASFCLFKKLFSQVPCMKNSVDDLNYESKDVDCFSYSTGNLYL